jgi:hypothetical protein
MKNQEIIRKYRTDYRIFKKTEFGKAEEFYQTKLENNIPVYIDPLQEPILDDEGELTKREVLGWVVSWETNYE